MARLTAIVLLCIFVAGLQADDPPVDVLATIPGRSLTLDDYQRHVLSVEGWSHWQGFVDRALIRDAAREAGIGIEYEALENAVEARIARQDSLLGGRKRVIESLAKRGQTIGSYRRRLRDELLYEQALEQLAGDDRAGYLEELRKQVQVGDRDSVMERFLSRLLACSMNSEAET